MPPGSFPEGLTENVFTSVAARFQGGTADVDECAIEGHDAGVEQTLIEKCLEFGVRQRHFGH